MNKIRLTKEEEIERCDELVRMSKANLAQFIIGLEMNIRSMEKDFENKEKFKGYDRKIYQEKIEKLLWSNLCIESPFGIIVEDLTKEFLDFIEEHFIDKESEVS